MSLRIFTAVDLNEELKDNISVFIGECAKLQKRSVKCVERKNLHITMKFLGDMDDGDVGRLAEDLAGIRLNAAEVTIEGAGAFPNVFFPSVIWAGVKNDGTLETLFAEIESRASVYGVNRETKPFHPHVTVARLKGKAEKELVDLVRNCQKKFGTFLADRFALIKSDLTPEGPVYTKLREYPMSARR